jgi:chromosome segregation ATPase
VLQAQVKHLEQLQTTNASKLQVADEEIARLSKAARSSGALEELQKHYQQQEEKYLAKLDAAERDKDNRAQERIAEAARIESMQRVIEEGNEERSVLRAEMDRLRALAVQATGAAAAARSSSGSALGEGAGPASAAFGANSAVMHGLRSASLNANSSIAMGASEHQLRMELERNIREHSTVVTQLEGEIASLRAELVHAQHEASGAAAQRTHLDQLHRNNELLRQEIAQLQARISSHESNSMQREADAEKVAAMESTIQQLGDEVTAVDARIRAMHAQHLAERERLQQQLERERSRFQQERDECDALVWRMTSELEFLVKDNALLKAKLEGLQDELAGY